MNEKKRKVKKKKKKKNIRRRSERSPARPARRRALFSAIPTSPSLPKTSSLANALKLSSKHPFAPLRRTKCFYGLVPPRGLAFSRSSLRRPRPGRDRRNTSSDVRVEQARAVARQVHAVEDEIFERLLEVRLPHERGAGHPPPQQQHPDEPRVRRARVVAPRVRHDVRLRLALQTLAVVAAEQDDLLPQEPGRVREELEVESRRELVRLPRHDARGVRPGGRRLRPEPHLKPATRRVLARAADAARRARAVPRREHRVPRAGL